MMFWIWVIAALFASVGIAWLFREDPGSVWIEMPGQPFMEMSFVVFVVILLLTFLVLYWAFRALGSSWRAPRTLARQREQRAQKLLVRGMQQLIEGRWWAAQKAFSESAEAGGASALNLIGAAQAAHHLNDSMRRDGYLRKAANLPERDALAVKLVQAEILMDSHQLTEAGDLLQQLYHQHSGNARALTLLARVYQQLGQWQDLRDIMPQIQKKKALSEQQSLELQRDMYQALLSEAAHRGALQELHTLWDEIPESLRTDEVLLIDYVGHLRDNNAAGEAEALLRGALQRRWSDKFAVAYGQIGRGDAFAQLQVAEGWSQQHADNSYLLLTLGRLAKRCRQYEKARDYLERSIGIMPSPDAYQELGDLLEQTDDKAMANQCYRTGLRLAAGQPEEKEGVELLPAASKEDEGTETESAPELEKVAMAAPNRSDTPS